MIIDSDLEMSVADPVAAKIGKEKTGRKQQVLHLALFGFFLIVVVVLQIASGAYRSEFSVYPDEPAHYVTSLMLRDYLLHFHFISPIRFAEDYYHHYPKVAFGHWPPLFYILQSLWMILFSASRASVRIEIAVTTALLAYSIFSQASRCFGWKGGSLAGLLTIALPLVQDYSDQEMAESLLTLLCFWSVVYFARYVDSQNSRDALWFGVFFSLAVLTKGSGWLLTFVPLIVLVLTRQVQLLRRLSFWLPVGLIAITCVPWQLMTMRMAERGWDGGSKPSLPYTENALIAFLGLFPRILGPVFLLFFLVGICLIIGKPLWRQSKVPTFGAAMFALLISVWVFHSIVPAGVEDRKLVIAVPAMVLFLFAGGRWFADLLPMRSPIFSWRYHLVTALGLVAFLLATFTIPKVRHYGFIEAARFLTSRADLKNATILVSSESGGEGLLISEMAMNQPKPQDTIIRATKALADVAWNGMDYHSIYSKPGEVCRYLQSEHIQFVVMDTFTQQAHFSHNPLLRKAINSGNRFNLVASFPSGTGQSVGQVQIYQVRPDVTGS